MRERRQTWWQIGKVLLTLAILVSVVWHFVQIFRADELWQAGVPIRPDWCGVAAVLYWLALGCSALLWHRLLRALGQRPSVLAVLRAYGVGQLGRYVPGKIVGVVVRSQLLTGPGVGRNAGVLTIIYETLTTLTAGALLAAVLLPWRGPDHSGRRWEALGLLVLLGVPLLPAVFNRVVRKVAASYPDGDAGSLPELRSATVAEVLAVAAGGWWLQGASLWAVLRALEPDAQPWSAAAWATDTAFVALATVVGFLVVIVPGGLGVRELVLQQLLTADLTPALGVERAAVTSAVAVLLLRGVWIVADVAAAGILYWVPVNAAVDSLPGRVPAGRTPVPGDA